MTSDDLHLRLPEKHEKLVQDPNELLQNTRRARLPQTRKFRHQVLIKKSLRLIAIARGFSLSAEEKTKKTLMASKVCGS